MRQIFHKLKSFPRLKNAARLDEIGILEKETQLAWFSGLILNSLLTVRISPTEALNRLGFWGETAKISIKTIRNRYYELAKQHHPDQCQTVPALCHQTMTELNEAYTTLVKKNPS